MPNLSNAQISYVILFYPRPTLRVCLDDRLPPKAAHGALFNLNGARSNAKLGEAV
jgi:hypothetical protein